MSKKREALSPINLGKGDHLTDSAIKVIYFPHFSYFPLVIAILLVWYFLGNRMNAVPHPVEFFQEMSPVAIAVGLLLFYGIVEGASLVSVVIDRDQNLIRYRRKLLGLIPIYGKSMEAKEVRYVEFSSASSVDPYSDLDRYAYSYPYVFYRSGSLLLRIFQLIFLGFIGEMTKKTPVYLSGGSGCKITLITHDRSKSLLILNGSNSDRTRDLAYLIAKKLNVRVG